MMLHLHALLPALVIVVTAAEGPAIDREKIVRSYNPGRVSSSDESPLQVGNGNFAFGVDVTGLQTFRPFGSLSTWGWHGFSLPDTEGQRSPDDFEGVEWWTHDRMVEYNQPSDDKAEIANWLRENPHRLNLGTIGFSFADKSVTEEGDLDYPSQELDLWTGKIKSRFAQSAPVTVYTVVDPDSSTVGIHVESDALANGDIGLFFDFPYPTHDKFDAPFVGVFNLTDLHETALFVAEDGASAEIKHVLGDTEYSLYLRWEGNAGISGPEEGTHRYSLSTSDATLALSAAFAETKPASQPYFDEIDEAARAWWKDYWTNGAFLDLTGTDNEDAEEIQRRTILSQYLVAINSASDLPPQESGLVNNGWYGKFHLEMYLWHSLQFARWNRFDLLNRSLSHLYPSMLDSARERARNQGYNGARWGKMTGPDLKDAPGEINSLLIWQQPHPMFFAETEHRRATATDDDGAAESVLERWDEVLTATADFMASYTWWNETTERYDLGPPMYPVSENTDPATTMNPTFELAYWRFGLDIAILWKERQGIQVPDIWVDVRDNLAPLPVEDDGTFPVYEGIPDMWTDKATTMDHPAMVAIYGLLPPPMSGPDLNMTVVERTADHVREYWDLDQSFGWDFSMLAMNAMRLGDADRAVRYLLHPSFRFDSAGYPVGGTRVPTPYFPSSSSFLLAVAMMAGGWDGAEGMHFPEDWTVVAEDFVVAM